MDYYQILHVSRTASQEEIKSAYRKLSRKYHPDNAGEQAREQFEKVQKAYAVLGEKEKRAAYDRELETRSAGGKQNKRQTGNCRQGYQNESFEKFFGFGSNGKKKADTGAGPLDTDKLFESFFGVKQ